MPCGRAIAADRWRDTLWGAAVAGADTAPDGLPLVRCVYKFFDDQSNYLAATVTYYSFAAIFPLLLLSSQVFGFLLQGNEELQKRCWTRP